MDQLFAKNHDIKEECFARDISGKREPRFFYHLQHRELKRLGGDLSITLEVWGSQCVTNSKSCGLVYIIPPVTEEV